ncbi:hypothetical protein DUNSADRAFT_17556, partial [Dunaliella salina]
MLEPELVGDCMRAMGDAANGTPVTVKCRLGVDQDDSYEALQRFVRVVSERSSVRHFIIHARKAFLKGLNPHQNRSVPPLRYEWLFGLKRDFPHLMFSLNGGIQSPYEALAYINHIPDAASVLHHDAGASDGNRANKVDEDAHGMSHTTNSALQAANGVADGAKGVCAPGDGANRMEEDSHGVSHTPNGVLHAANGVAERANRASASGNEEDKANENPHGISYAANGTLQAANGVTDGAYRVREGANHTANGALHAAHGATEGANRVSEGTVLAPQNGAPRSLKRGAGEVVDDGRVAECCASGGTSGWEAPAESKAPTSAPAAAEAAAVPTAASAAAAAAAAVAAAAAETTCNAERMQSHADASTSGAPVRTMGYKAANAVSKLAHSASHNGGQDVCFDGSCLGAPVAAHMVPPGVAAVEGVMIGRAAYNDPWGVLGNADRAVFGAESNPAISRRQ